MPPKFFEPPPLTSLAEQHGLFDLVYADPPWRMQFSPTSDRHISNHYNTMELPDITALPVPSIVKPQAVLYLWATAPLLPEAIRTMAAWGFEYRTSMVWVKHAIGLGFWCRNRHELLLIGKRGEHPAPAPELRPDSVIDARRGKHSEKPESVRVMLEKLYPDHNKLEMFARTVRPGWITYGNQDPGQPRAQLELMP